MNLINANHIFFGIVNIAAFIFYMLSYFDEIICCLVLEFRMQLLCSITQVANKFTLGLRVVSLVKFGVLN